MKRLMNRAAVVGLCVLFSALTTTASAQDTSVTGGATDATDARLPGVTVTALHVDTGNTYVGVTDAAGQYQMSGMRTGVYKVTADLSGFRPVVQENIELLVGQRAVLNFRMTLSSVEESVTVTGAAPLVDVSQSKLGGNVDSRQVQELPVTGAIGCS